MGAAIGSRTDSIPKENVHNHWASAPIGLRSIHCELDFRGALDRISPEQRGTFCEHHSKSLDNLVELFKGNQGQRTKSRFAIEFQRNVFLIP
jgi:hypothetical protein